jgi:hypothetical protein
MRIFNKISEKYHYLLDSFNASDFNVKIDHFALDEANQMIVVIYRIGRQKLLHKMKIIHFENEYFDRISNYDKHRITKLSTLQDILITIFDNNTCSKEHYISYIAERIKNEQLF